MKFLSGKKTNIIVVVIMLMGVLKYLDYEIPEGTMEVLLGAVVAALRAGVKKV